MHGEGGEDQIKGHPCLQASSTQGPAARPQQGSWTLKQSGRAGSGRAGNSSPAPHKRGGGLGGQRPGVARPPRDKAGAGSEHPSAQDSLEISANCIASTALRMTQKCLNLCKANLRVSPTKAYNYHVNNS